MLKIVPNVDDKSSSVTLLNINMMITQDVLVVIPVL